jgi:hypothetical protein
MTRLRITLLLAALSLSAAPLHANTIEDGGAWLNLTAEGSIAGKLRWYMELQPRFQEEGREFSQYLVRPGIHYRLTDKLTIGGGYGYIRTRTDQGYSDEDRIWQQAIYNTSWKNNVALSSRTRLEQRFLDDDNDMGWRFRQLLRISRPLSAWPSIPSISPVLWNEVFVGLNNTDWGAKTGFDQNRLFAGFAWQATPKARLEVGYLNQYVRRDAQDRMNHVLSTGLFLNF